MPCADPIPAYRPANGGPILFKLPTNGRAYTPIQIPCGLCILCRQEYARQTAVRITHEAQTHEQNCFVTLSYDDEHLPTYGSLDYTHLVKFWKRLRKHTGKLRYYAVGEYGDKTLRPHYHACIFGHDFVDGRVIIRETPTRLWTHPTLEKIWGLGFVAVGTLNFQTARYTASYVLKKLRQKQKYVRIDEETGELLSLVQPRAFMSKNIGREWWDLWHRQVDAHDTVIIDGQKQKPPKAYDKWAKDRGPDFIVGTNGDTAIGQHIRDQKHEQKKEKRRKSAVKQTVEQLRARATNAHARIKNKSKTV